MASTSIKGKTNNPVPNPKTPTNFFMGVVKVTTGTFLGLTLLTTSAIAGGLVGLAVSFRNLPDVRVLKKLCSFSN